MINDTSEKLLSFIKNSPSCYHAVNTITTKLSAVGYKELNEADDWVLRRGGKYFTVRNMSSVIAFRIPKNGFGGFMITASHSDSPAFKIKENTDVEACGKYTKLNVEKYGGMLCSTWFDRPLSVAGKVTFLRDDKLISRLVNIDRDILMIPSVAIHMDRNANENASFNPAIDMQPLFGDEKAKGNFLDIICESTGIDKTEVLSTDLFLYNRCAGTVWGSSDEYISSPRLDDLQCAYAALRGFLASADGESAPVYCVFDNEEVGSGTKQGADSTFLYDVLTRVCEAFGKSRSEYLRAVASSFMISADNAHAVHPNHPEYADSSHRPFMNEGIVIKYNANQRYTTDSVSAAMFEAVCRKAGVPVQRFANRPDLPGGSTLGNISSAHVSLNTVDIGLPQLAMHSAYETAGALDTDYLIKAVTVFYSMSLRAVSASEYKIEL